MEHYLLRTDALEEMRQAYAAYAALAERKREEDFHIKKTKEEEKRGKVR